MKDDGGEEEGFGTFADSGKRNERMIPMGREKKTYSQRKGDPNQEPTKQNQLIKLKIKCIFLKTNIITNDIYYYPQ